MEVLVTVPEDVDGVVTVSVDGVNYATEKVNDTTYKTIISGLMSGKYTINATLSNDHKYINKTSDNKTLEVVKVVNYDLNVTVVPKEFGESTVITVVVPEDLEGNVTVVVDGEKCSVKPVAGVATLELDNLTAGTHVINVSYSGDDKYQPKFNTTSFVVPKADAPLDVSADDIKVGEDAVIVINVPEDATGTVVVDVNGTKTFAEIVDGVATVSVPSLGNGTYNATVKYPGDNNYVANEASVVFNVDKVDDYTMNVTPNVDKQDVVLDIELPKDATGTITVSVDGEKVITVPVNDTITLNDLVPGDHNITVTYNGDDKYNPESKDLKVTVPKIDGYDVLVDVNGSVVVVSLPEDATGNVTVVVDGNETIEVPVVDGTAVVPLGNLTPGNHSVDVIYPGDDVYVPKSNSTVITVPKIDEYDVLVDVNGSVVVVSLPEDATGNVTVVVDGNETIEVPVVDGTAVVPLGNLTPGNHSVDVIYPGDDIYVPKSNSTVITVPKIDEYDVIVDAIVDGRDVEITVTLPDDIDGIVLIDVNDVVFYANVSDGKTNIHLSDVDNGNYTVVAKFLGDDKYAPKENSTSFIVNKKIIPDVVVDISENASDVTVTLPNDATGNVTVVVDGKPVANSNVTNGTANIPLGNLTPGNHTVEVIYSGDDKYNPIAVNETVDVNGVRIIAPDVVKYYSGPERLLVYVLDNKGKGIASKEVKITINGITYTRTTDADGRASLAINLNSGNYTARVVAGEYDFDVVVNVEVKPTIYAEDVVKVFRNGTHYWALFLDGNGNPLVNTNVTYNINGVFYTRTTNATGWCKLNINLEKGKYILTAINPVTGEMRSNNVTVFTLIETSDLTKYYHNASQFVGRVRAADGNWAGAGEAVAFNIHGVFYTRYTNGTGHFKLNINLDPGDYIITSYYKDCREGNSIKVLPVLIVNDMTMKQGDGSQFVARLVDGQGKPLANQHIHFNIHGVLYDRLTDSNGESRLNINLQAGEYLITSSYNGHNVGSTITVTS